MKSKESLLWRSLDESHMRWLSFYIDFAYITAIAVGVLTSLSALTFVARERRRAVPMPA